MIGPSSVVWTTFGVTAKDWVDRAFVFQIDLTAVEVSHTVRFQAQDIKRSSPHMVASLDYLGVR